LDNGVSPFSTIDGTSPCVFTGNYGRDGPLRNAEPGGGVMTIQQATQNSVNCAFLRLGLSVGLNKVTDMAHRLGVRTPLNPNILSLSIGGDSVTPLDMASAYATLADDGVYHNPTFVSKITDEQGTVIYQDNDHGTRVVPAQEVRIATSLLQSVVTGGTGTAARLNDGRPVAGKTGTTNSEHDAWFVGYTPQLSTAIWMGSPYSENVSMTNVGGVTVFGGTYPARIFSTYMSAVLSGQPQLGFPGYNSFELPASKYILAPYSISAPGSNFSQSPSGSGSQQPFFPPGGGSAPTTSPPPSTPATTVPSPPRT
ncbi:MAG: transglycosylase domain-containing protein, partial [Acidimicrobiales bacterium]